MDKITDATNLVAVSSTQSLDELSRAKWTQASREAYHKERPWAFAGPDLSFPIRDGSDVGDAWGLAGHADNPDAVRAKIKSIAKRLGLEGSLPDTAKEDDSKERSMNAATIPTPSTDDKSPHPPMTGKHSHAHPHMDGYDHEHEHEHNNDNIHDHAHTHAQHRSTPTVIQTSDRNTHMYVPLMRIDAAKREVWGQATAEVPDSYGTIFGYYPEAWKTWRGNIREQHDPKKAVGKRIDLDFNDQERAVYVGSRISRGAPDTWLKVEDDVLSGYSASVIPDPEFGPDPKKWPTKEYNGKKYPYLPRYSVAELSLVDNPACPGCNIQIVRADGFATDVLDLTEEEPPAEQKPLERAGARMSKDTQSKMHDSIAHTLRAAYTQMQNCGCDNCNAAMKLIDPDGDKDIDLGGYDDTDNDWQSLYGGDGGGSAEMERTIISMLERALSPVYVRLQAIAGTIARSSNATPQIPNIEALMESTITRAMEATITATKSELGEVRSALAEVKDQVNRIADTPMPGAPILNTGALPRPTPVQKTLSTDPYQAPPRSGSSVYDAIARMSEQGMLDTPERQADAVAAGLMAQRMGR